MVGSRVAGPGGGPVWAEAKLWSKKDNEASSAPGTINTNSTAVMIDQIRSFKIGDGIFLYIIKSFLSIPCVQGFPIGLVLPGGPGRYI
jgi:hypothetical protein